MAQQVAHLLCKQSKPVTSRDRQCAPVPPAERKSSPLTVIVTFSVPTYPAVCTHNCTHTLSRTN
jgi:hypothetical protein